METAVDKFAPRNDLVETALREAETINARRVSCATDPHLSEWGTRETVAATAGLAFLCLVNYESRELYRSVPKEEFDRLQVLIPSIIIPAFLGIVYSIKKGYDKLYPPN